MLGGLVWFGAGGAILVWRTKKMRTVTIPYRSAYWVALKATVIASALALFAYLAFGLSGLSNARLSASVQLVLATIAWWFAHANGLLKVRGPSRLLSAEEARAITASVFGYLVAGLGAIGVLVVALWLALTALIWQAI